MSLWWRVLRAFVFTLTGLLILVTFLPIIHSNQWWIRIWDFPRLQIGGLLVLMLLVLPTMFERRSWVSVSVILAAAAALACGYFPTRTWCPRAGRIRRSARPAGRSACSTPMC